MKSLPPYLAVTALLMLLFGIAISIFSMQSQAPENLFPATVNPDCAPWDGAAFTVSIPYDPVSVMTISIWKPPVLEFPTTFSLPDDAGQVGYASILSATGPLSPLHGEVWFQSVELGRLVEGRFNLTSERGEQFKGKFIAEWEGQRAFCG